ncbi:MAG: hypothetical protein HN691_14200 [Bacteroidetes bacterium]|nr:hypothetical protein [Bacteroidota bacterium]
MFRLAPVDLNTFFYDHILEQQGFLIKHQIRGFAEQVEKEGITKVLKGLKVYKTTGRGENRTNKYDFVKDVDNIAISKDLESGGMNKEYGKGAFNG